MKMDQVTLATVTPVYSGAKYLDELVSKLEELRTRWAEENAPVHLVESIFVLDGAIDDSEEVLKRISSSRPWVRVINLSRNFGQHAATVAGICHSASDWIVTLDEDLQHQPDEIEGMLRVAASNNCDLVYALPATPPHGNSWRDKTSRLIKRLLAKLTGVEQISIFNSFRLIRGTVGRAAASSSSSQTYLDIALSWYTTSVQATSIEMNDDRFQQSGTSGYSISRLVGHARRLLISSEANISSLGLTIGAVGLIVATLLGGNVILTKIFYPDTITEAGWASLAALICAFGGILVALVCILMEYVNVILQNQLGRPTFFTVDRSQDSTLAEWLDSRSA